MQGQTKVIKNKNNMYFKFEHESSIIPALLEIEVSYNAYYRESDYENPSEFSVSDVEYTIYCGKLDITECIDESNNKALQDELETAINEACSDNFFKIK